MNRVIGIFLVAALVLSVSVIAADNPFAGLKKCQMCHKGENKGSIYETWEASPHARAFTVLGEDAATELYAKLGKEGNPQEDADCLKCHVTGYGQKAELIENIVVEEGITCESCHGAGGAYWKKTVMADHEKAVAAGLNPEPKDACVNCHNENSPTYKEFKFEERWEKVKHSLPDKNSLPE